MIELTGKVTAVGTQVSSGGDGKSSFAIMYIEINGRRIDFIEGKKVTVIVE